MAVLTPLFFCPINARLPSHARNTKGTKSAHHRCAMCRTKLSFKLSLPRKQNTRRESHSGKAPNLFISFFGRGQKLCDARLVVNFGVIKLVREGLAVAPAKAEEGQPMMGTLAAMTPDARALKASSVCVRVLGLFGS